MRKLNYTEILSQRMTTEESLKAERHPIAFVLHNIRSVYNVGSIFRTADSALVAEMILTGFTPHPPRDDIHKTALDAENSVPWKYFKEPIDAIKYLKSNNYNIYALEITDKKRLYHTVEKEEFPIALFLGNELTGLDDEIIELCDDAIEIPMFGVKHSLNVSVSAGICAYELVKIFTFK